MANYRLIKRDKVHGSLYTDRRSSPTSYTRSGIAPGFSSATRLKLPNPATTSETPWAAGHHHDPRPRRVLHLLSNRCAHRGNQVCNDEKGNASAFAVHITVGHTGTTASWSASLLQGLWPTQTGPCPRPGAQSRLLPRLRLRQFRDRRPFAVGAPRRRSRRDRPVVRPLPKAVWISPPDGCSTRPGRTGNCWPRTKPTATPAIRARSIFGVTGSPIGQLTAMPPPR